MRIALISFVVFLTSSSQGQTLAELESKMALHLEVIGSEASTDEKLAASDSFETLLLQAFSQDGCFEYPFEKIPKVSKLMPEDERFRLFNWNIPLENGRHTFRLYLLFPNGDFRQFEENRELKHEDESSVIKPNDWYGAIYYELHPKKIKRKTYYTLVGWDGKNDLTTIKVLDVLVVNKKNEVELGFPLFEKEGDLVNRRVFEYADEVVMNLKWLEPKEMIIFDKLEPKTPNLKGNYAFYGPSTAFDGYSWTGDYWKLHEFIDMSRPKSAETGAQFNFPDRPDLNRKREEKNPLIDK